MRETDDKTEKRGERAKIIATHLNDSSAQKMAQKQNSAEENKERKREKTKKNIEKDEGDEEEKMGRTM